MPEDKKPRKQLGSKNDKRRPADPSRDKSLDKLRDAGKSGKEKGFRR